MNPFLESTVAAPQPGARWRRPSRSCRKTKGHEDSSVKPLDERLHLLPAQSGSRGPLRRLRGTVKLLLATGALMLPGLVQAIDINTASAQQLQEVKGIGPRTASLIVEERERGGRFESMNDVSERVKGIGPKKAATLEAAGLKVGAAASAETKPGDVATRAPRRTR